ncbi:MAG: DUF1800 domain-containing protein [Saprospiraceae bacterium]|nr:DUF1800 domain-containing protein [Saprospiraceae bacterium]
MAGFSNLDLTPYEGAWTSKEASHLLRRTMYGPSKEDIDTAVKLGLDGIIDELFDIKPLPTPPINFNYGNDPIVPIGESWVGKPYTRSDTSNQQIGSRLASLRSWTVGVAIKEGISLREKMTLFWHNHFVTAEIRDANFAYNNITIYRENFTGNFRDLTKVTTIDTAMLRYLNGTQNSKQRPNENFARELLELFTIGKGPQVAEGDYTNYTEHDIGEISKILTGWVALGYLSRNQEIAESRFVPNRHDTSTKTLSARFGQVQIPDMADQEYQHLIDIIFQQDEVANFIARKVYRWFVYYEIDDQIEQNIIKPMASILRDADYEMEPMLRALLSSQHFYDAYAVGAIIKNPFDFIVGLIKVLQVDYGSNYQEQYNLWRRFYGFSGLLQQDYFNAPTVAGWKAYYQEPLYYRSWINASTISSRFLFSSLIVNGMRVNRIMLQADLLNLIEGIEDRHDPNALIDNLGEILFPEAITDGQKEYLKSLLIPGLPDYEWTVEYDLYKTNPEDEELKNALNARLQTMLIGMLSLPEYQLS